MEEGWVSISFRASRIPAQELTKDFTKDFGGQSGDPHCKVTRVGGKLIDPTLEQSYFT